MNYEDDLHNATPDRLAEMLEEIAQETGICSKQAMYDGDTKIAKKYEKEELVLKEAARRLRERTKPTFPKRN